MYQITDSIKHTIAVYFPNNTEEVLNNILWNFTKGKRKTWSRTIYSKLGMRETLTIERSGALVWIQ